MRLTTLQFRIKDETSRKRLCKMATSVNFVWNYCNQVNYESWCKFRKTYTNFDLHKKTAGCTKNLGLLSRTVEAVCDEFVKSSRQSKKRKLSWRSNKRSLGWIPFKSPTVKLTGDVITYGKQLFRIWLSRPIEGRIRFGSFAQNSKGQWFINLVIEDADRGRTLTGKGVGIDLGLKTIATLSNGSEFHRENLTIRYGANLAMAQRAKKKRLVRAIHVKIKNSRKDWNHKVTTELVTTYDTIAVGNVNSSRLKKTRMAKSVSDASWSDFKRMLSYKAIALGSRYIEVNESFSTVTCSKCGLRTGPKGLSGLGVREWDCSNCGSSHHRDVNGAINILLSAQGIVRRREFQKEGCQMNENNQSSNVF